MPWMQDLMVACQEVNHDDLSLSRSGGCLAREPQAVQGSVAIVGHDATIPVAEPSGSSRTEDNKPPAEATRNALQWATSVRDLGVLQSLAESLPAPVLQEQVALYEASAAIVPVQPAVAGAQRILVHPGLLKSRVQVAEAYHKFMLASGWLPGSRKPRHSASKFCTTLVWSTKVPHAGEGPPTSKVVRGVARVPGAGQARSGGPPAQDRHVEGSCADCHEEARARRAWRGWAEEHLPLAAGGTVRVVRRTQALRGLASPATAARHPVASPP